MRKVIIEKLNAIPMTELFKLYHVDWEEGRNFRCPFPAHAATGNTPSFKFYPQTNSASCFGCHKGGGPVQFVQNMEGISYEQACKKLMQLFNIEDIPEFSFKVMQEKAEQKALEKEVQTKFAAVGELLAQASRNYLEKTESKDELIAASFMYLMIPLLNESEFLSLAVESRILGITSFIKKISPEIKENQRVSLLVIKGIIKNSQSEIYEREREFKPVLSGIFNESVANIKWPLEEGRYLFPIMLPGNVVIGFTGRTLKNEFIKYQTIFNGQFSKDDVFYGLEEAVLTIPKFGFCIIVEGVLDVLRVRAAGFSNVVAPLSTIVSRQGVLLIKSLTKNFMLLHDSDYGGNVESEISRKNLESLGCYTKRVLLPEGEDPDSYGKKDLGGLTKLIQEFSKF